MTSKQARNIIMEFWNSGEPGKEETEIKTRQTAMRAVLDLELVGKVVAIKREGKLYLINLELAKVAITESEQLTS